MISSTIDIMEVLARGLNITITVLIGSAIFGYAMAFIAGFMRMSRFKLIRVPTAIYVEFFRGTSLLVQMFWIYYSFPISAYWAGVIAISLNYGAYMSEVVRGAILAVSKGQTEAAIALNMTRFQRMRLVILPQAVRMMLPEFCNYLIQMLKATSLVYMIGLADITYRGMIYRSSNLDDTFTVLALLLIVYFVLALPLLGLSKWLEKLAAKGVASE